MGQENLWGVYEICTVAVMWNFRLKLIGQLFQFNEQDLNILMSAGGLEAVVKVQDLNFAENKELVVLRIDWLINLLEDTGKEYLKSLCDLLSDRTTGTFFRQPLVRSIKWSIYRKSRKPSHGFLRCEFYLGQSQHFTKAFWRRRPIYHHFHSESP